MSKYIFLFITSIFFACQPESETINVDEFGGGWHLISIRNAQDQETLDTEMEGLVVVKAELRFVFENRSSGTYIYDYRTFEDTKGNNDSYLFLDGAFEVIDGSLYMDSTFYFGTEPVHDFDRAGNLHFDFEESDFVFQREE